MPPSDPTSEFLMVWEMSSHNEEQKKKKKKVVEKPPFSSRLEEGLNAEEVERVFRHLIEGDPLKLASSDCWPCRFLLNPYVGEGEFYCFRRDCDRHGDADL